MSIDALDKKEAIEKNNEGLKETAELKNTADSFSDNYVSEVSPEAGVFGDASEFTNEIIEVVNILKEATTELLEDYESGNFDDENGEVTEEEVELMKEFLEILNDISDDFVSEFAADSEIIDESKELTDDINELQSLILGIYLTLATLALDFSDLDAPLDSAKAKKERHFGVDEINAIKEGNWSDLANSAIVDLTASALTTLDFMGFVSIAKNFAKNKAEIKEFLTKFYGLNNKLKEKKDEIAEKIENRKAEKAAEKERKKAEKAELKAEKAELKAEKERIDNEIERLKEEKKHLKDNSKKKSKDEPETEAAEAETVDETEAELIEEA